MVEPLDDIVIDEIDTDADDELDHADEQGKSSKDIRELRIARLKPYQYKPGQSGNPTGRKPGKSMKEYAKEMLASMTEDERQEFMRGLPKDVIWKMAEGLPTTKTDLTTNGKDLVMGLTPEQKAMLDKLIDPNAQPSSPPKSA